MSLFGTQPTQGTGTSVFGANKGTSLFGSNTTTNNTTGSLFGNTTNQAKTTQSSSLFGNTQTGSLFSANQQTNSSPFGKPTGSIFGTTTNNAPSSSIFGGNTSTSLFGNSNQNNSTTTSSLFGNTNQNSSTSLFGTNNTSNNLQQGQTSLFGNSATANNQNKSLFGTTPVANQTSNVFQNQGNNQTNQSVDAFYISLSQPCIFGDDRDAIIAKYNQLLAMWASNGQGFCSLGPVTYSKDNVFSRFKAIVYNILPVSSDEDGLVRLTIKQPCKELIKHSQQIKETLFRILESKPNIVVQIEEIRPSLGKESETESELTIKVVESRNRGQNIDQASNSGQIISASLLSAHLSSPNVASQLSSNLSVTNVSTELAPSQASLNSYCKTPPAGFDKMVWQQFILENPRRDCLIPVPLLGIEELKIRKREQIVFGNQQKASLIKISDSLRKIEAKNAVISQKIFGLKSKQCELSHRILKVISKKEVSRKSGYAISAEEEMQRGNLEKLVTQLKSIPSQSFSRTNTLGISNGGLKQRMSAIMSAVNDIEKNSKSLQQSDVDVGIDSDAMKELIEYLANKSKGINEMRLMVNVISEKISVITNYSSGSSQFSSGNYQSNETRPKIVSFA